MIQKEPAIKKVLDKLRHLVRLFRQSSIATGRLLQKCGLTLAKDKWPSTYLMMSRALEVKDHVASVAESMTWDSLQTSEWQKLAILKDLLLSFAEHSQVLESDTNSLCLALLCLRCWTWKVTCRSSQKFMLVATILQLHWHRRWVQLWIYALALSLDVTNDRFSPIAAAACFVEPNVSAEVLNEKEDKGIPDLLKKAEESIINTVTPRVWRILMRMRKMGRQRQRLCQSGLDLDFSVPVVQQGPGPPGPLSGRRSRSTKTCCPKLMSKMNPA